MASGRDRKIYTTKPSSWNLHSSGRKGYTHRMTGMVSPVKQHRTGHRRHGRGCGAGTLCPRDSKGRVSLLRHRTSQRLTPSASFWLSPKAAGWLLLCSRDLVHLDPSPRSTPDLQYPIPCTRGKGGASHQVTRLGTPPSRGHRPTCSPSAGCSCPSTSSTPMSGTSLPSHGQGTSGNDYTAHLLGEGVWRST